MSKLRLIILVSLLAVAVLSACTSSSDTSIESAALSDISVEDAAAAIVKAQEITDAVDATIQATKISGAVDATVEAMAVVPTETATPPLDPTVVDPTVVDPTVVDPTVVIETVAASTVTESTGTVTPTASVVVQVATPTLIVKGSIETVIATAAVTPTTVPIPVPVPTPTPTLRPTPTPTPILLNYNIIEGTTPIGTSGYNYTLQGFFVEDYDLVSDLISTQIKWGDSNDYQPVSVMQGTGEILANHTFTSGGSFYGEIRLVSINTGEVLANVPINIVMNLGDIATAVPTITVADVVTPTSTVSAGATSNSIVEPVNSRSGSDAIDPLIKYSPVSGEKIVDQSILNQYSPDNYLHFDSFDFHGEYQGNNANTSTYNQNLIPKPDPTDTISLPSDFPILGNVFTIEVQVYSSVDHPNMAHRTIIGNDANPKKNDRVRPPTITINKENGINQIRYGFGVGPDSKGKRRVIDTDMAENQWYHIAFTFDGTTTKLFIDGVEIDSSDFASGLTPHPVPLSIIGRQFLGKMDEVRIWSIARTQEDIQSTLTGELIGNEPGLIAYYPMDVDQNWELIDRGPNNHHATITNVEILQRHSSLDCPNANGTLACPYPTIREALDTAQAGDSIFIKDGRYPEVIFKELFNQSHETNGPKVTLRGESTNVILDGTVPLIATWQLVNGRYEASVDMNQLSNAAGTKVENIYALWVDDRYMIPAMPVNFTNPTDVSTSTQNNPEIGTVFDLNLTSPYYLPGEQTLEMQDEYIVGDINNLDAIEEWSFDEVNKKLYLIPADKIPDSENVRVRVRTKIVNIEFSDNLEFRNLHFFAGAFNFLQSSYILFEDSKFSHSWEAGISYLRPGRDEGWMRGNTFKRGTNNTVRNAIFQYINDARALKFSGSMYPLVENVLFQYNDWFKNTVWSPTSNDNFRGGNKWHDETSIVGGSTWRYVTSQQNHTGGINPGLNSLVEYARIQDQYINIDGSGIQRTRGNASNSTTRYSWLLNNQRNGMRLDSSCGGTDAVIHNVVSAGNKLAFRLKGDRHRAFHLLGYDTNQNDLSMPRNKYCGDDYVNDTSETMAGNLNSRLLNSVAEKNISAHTPDAGDPNITLGQGDLIAENTSNEFLLNQSGLWYGRALDEDKIAPYTYPHFELQDPWVENRERSDTSLQSQFGLNPFTGGVQGYDFRPRKGSPLVDGGVVISGINNGEDIDPNKAPNHPPSYLGQHRKFVGEAPDIGAYEYGDSVYWIPGYRSYYPTVPIPGNGAVDVPMEYGLAFNYPWKTDYSGITAEVTINGPGLNKTVSLTYPNNVVFETFLPGQTYTWSVEVGEISSQIWSFTVANKIHPLNDRSVDVDVDEKLIPNHNKSLSLSDGVLSFMRFDIPPSINSDYQVFLNLTPETVNSSNGQIMLYKYNYQGWGEKLDSNNLGLLDHSLLTALQSISTIDASSSLSVEITDYIESTGEISFALGVLDPNDQLSFFSKEKMVTDGVDIYVTAGDLLGPSGSGSGYAPQTDVWPSISFVKNN